jgi:hypothetical protein
MGNYDITYNTGETQQRGHADTDLLLDLHEQGQLVAVHGPVEARRELDIDLERGERWRIGQMQF